MKKVSLVLTFALFTFISTSTFAQEATKEAVKDAVVEVKEKVSDVATGIQDKAAAVATPETPEAPEAPVQEKVGELPEAVTKTLTEKYAGFTAEKVSKAVVAGKDVYTIRVVNEGDAKTVIVDAEGNVIEK